MNKILSLIFGVIVISNSIVSCQSNNSNQDFSITTNELKSLMESDTNLVILDVRTPQELLSELGQIEGVINIPVQILADHLSELEKYKNKNIAVICRSGNRSVYATQILLENGFKAKNVLGGMIEYNKQD